MSGGYMSCKIEEWVSKRKKKGGERGSMPLNALLIKVAKTKQKYKFIIFMYFDYEDIFKLIIYFEPKNCYNFFYI